MIFKDIAEWEVGDSELAQHTITNLHFEIDRLNKIIKEAKEYINKISSEPNVFGHYAIDGNCKKYLLGILDKVGSDE